MSYHPTALELVRRLRVDQAGAGSLAAAIETGAAAYRCPACNYAGGDPIVGLVDEASAGPLAGRVIFACPVCAPPDVRTAYGLDAPKP